MADPAYFGSASVPADNGSNATGQLTITPPASMQRGDLVIVHCESRTATPTWSIGVDGGQSWTAESAFFNGRIFWCVYDGTWDADPRFDCTLSACTSAVMQVFRGQGTSYGWEQDVAFQGFNASGPVTTCTITGVTTVTNKAVGVAGWDTQSSRTWSGLTAGWSVAGDAQYRNTAQSDQTLTHAYKLMPTAGATGDVSNDKSSATGGFDSWIMAWRNVAPKIAVDPVSYAFTGQAVSVERGRKVVAAAASYAVTVAAVAVERGYEVAVAAASFAATYQAVAVEYGREVAAASAAFAFTGQAVSVERGHEIVASAASFAHTPAAVSLEYGRDVSAEAVAFGYTGSNVTFVYEPATGLYILAENASFAFSPAAVAVERGYEVTVAASSFGYSGTDASVEYGYVTSLEGSSFGFDAGGITFEHRRAPPSYEAPPPRKPGHWIAERRFNEGGRVPLRK